MPQLVIKKIILQNIQSLPKAEIEPAPPGELTVIVGPSDSGKTTLASRAEQKLFFNSVPTKEIVRRKAKKASITAIYDTPDNLSVSWCWKGRKTSAGKAWWEVKRDGAEPEIFAGSNRPGQVPEAIQNITGITPVKIGNLKLNMNFNRQLDGPFLGASVSPTERYRVLGALAGTLEVDAAEKEVSTEILRARRREKELSNPDGKKKGKIEELEERIAEYDYLDDLKSTTYRIETELKAIENKQNLRDKLQHLWADIQETWMIVNSKQSEINYLGNKIVKIQTIISDTESKISTYQKLASLRGQIITQKEDACQASNTLKKTEKTGHIQLKINDLCHTYDALEKLKNLLTMIDFQAQKINAAQSILTTTANAQQATELLEKVVEANYKREKLVPFLTEISKAVEQIKRNNHILEQTSETTKAQYILGLVEDNIPRVGQLKNLATRLKKGRKFLSEAEVELKATADFEKGKDIISFIEGQEARADKLCRARLELIHARAIVGQIDKKLALANEKHQKAAQEYRELLKNAGICEDCPVVEEVLAAAEGGS